MKGIVRNKISYNWHCTCICDYLWSAIKYLCIKELKMYSPDSSYKTFCSSSSFI